MSDPMKQAWSDVEQRLSALGQMMKERYRGAGEDEPADDPSPGGAYEAGAALKSAFDRLVAAVREVGDRAADVARDEDVKAQARQAAASLNDALSATVTMIGEQVEGLFKRPVKGGAGVQPELTPDRPAEPELDPGTTADDATP